MNMNEVFTPNSPTIVANENQLLTAGVANARVTVKGGSILRLVNNHATQLAFIVLGQGAEVAAVTDLVLPPGNVVCFVRVPVQCSSLSYIASGAATPVYVSTGS